MALLCGEVADTIYRQQCNCGGLQLLVLTAVTIASSEESRVPISYWVYEENMRMSCLGPETFSTVSGWPKPLS